MTFSAISILGYGRFGRALGTLCSEAGAAVRAYDPSPGALAEVPQAQRAASPAELAAGAELLVLAVPVPQTLQALQALRPHLHPGQLVLDVGSVKVHPGEDCAAVLGPDIPWVGTHPLFGPMSLALAEHPLRVVVCPNGQHPGAAARARAFYEGLGCEVIEEDAARHDWVMASTHAMAFFLAKGMLDAGFGENVPFSPPSFQAMARTIESVRADAGHLFLAIQRDNPFGAAARGRLLGTLAEIDRALRQPEQAPASDAAQQPAAMNIPDLGQRSPELREVRELIDGLDHELVELLARRRLLAQRAARAKAALGEPVRDAAREAALFSERRSWAQERGLDPEQVEAIFARIVGYSRRVQGEEP